MIINIRGYVKEVNFISESTSYTRFTVGMANVKVPKEWAKPFIWIPGKTFDEFKRHIPLILEFVYEYKRLVSQPGTPAALSIVGATPDSKYKYQKGTPGRNYVSSVPQWITEMKEWKVCSGPYRTYKRRVRLPEESRELAEKYIPFCCQCEFRADCKQPCITPDVCSQEELFVG